MIVEVENSPPLIFKSNSMLVILRTMAQTRDNIANGYLPDTGLPRAGSVRPARLVPFRAGTGFQD